MEPRLEGARFEVPPGAPRGPSPAIGHGTWDPAAQGAAPARRRGARAFGLSQIPWMPLDAAVATAAALLAHALSPVYARAAGTPHPLTVALAHAFALVLAAHVAGLYDWNVLTRWGLVAGRALAAALASPALTLGVFYLVLYQPIGRWVVGWTATLTAVGLIVPRYVSWRALRRRRRRVVFLGDGPLARETVDALALVYPGLYHATICPRSELPVEGVRPDGLVELCRKFDADELVLPGEAGARGEWLVPALRCLALGCRIQSEADFYEDAFRRVPVEHVAPSWVLAGGWEGSNPFGDALKRGLDTALAVALLAATAPLALAIAAAIRIAGGGPVLYSQLRVGRYGRPFRIYKFRTMQVDAEDDGQAVWAAREDPRRTPLGRWLRRLRLDELPQLANILQGEMSFVGPRPERPEFVAALERAIPYYSWRHLLRPGLTGWAQIHCPYGASPEDAHRKLEFDLYYLRHRSLATDLAIGLRTVSAALRGAR